MAALLTTGPSHLIKEFTEQEPLIGGKRPGLKQAVALCKASNATLVFGKLDRMRNAVHWLQFAYDEGVRILAVDVPELNRAYFYQLKLEDQSRRRAVGQNIKSSLACAQAQGVLLGGKRRNAEGLKQGPEASVVSRREGAYRRDQSIMAEIRMLRHRGVTTLTGISKRLNQMGRKAPRGGDWSPAQVRLVIKKFEDI